MTYQTKSFSISVETFYEILRSVQDEKSEKSEFFPDRLRAFRVSLNIGQAELGKIVGRTASTISDWEKGKTQPGLQDIEKLAARLGVSSSRLAFGDLSTPSPDKAVGVISEHRDLKDALRDLLEQSIAQAADDPARLGWIREQMLQHIRPPSHWVDHGAEVAKGLILLDKWMNASSKNPNEETSSSSGT